tara:strand:+ start:124 stop:1353 length:1230 start_codon:yes stop_codon:yes gene_type:complete
MKIRRRDSDIGKEHSVGNLKFKETTYHFSSKEKEEQFVKAQFETPEQLARYREYRLEWHRRSNEFDAGKFPLTVICELVSVCNLHCSMCYTRKEEFQKMVIGSQRMMPWDMVKSIIDECAEIGVCSILFSWRGESSMYKSVGSDSKAYDFSDVLKYARDAGILEITSLTNGRLLNKELITKIVEAQPNWISFSIDGLGDSYRKIRVGGASEDEDPFRVVTKNIMEIVRYREERGYKKPQIRTNTIYPAISNDPDAYLKYMEDIGVGLVTLNELLDFSSENLPDDAILDDFFCQYPFQRLAVSANGVIMPCPGSHLEEEEISLGLYPGGKEKKVNAGSGLRVVQLPKMSLKEAYNSDKIKWIREFHKKGRRKEIVTCKQCRHGAVTHGVEWIPENWDMERMEWRGGMWRE